MLLGGVWALALGAVLAPVSSMAAPFFWSPGYRSPAAPMYRSQAHAHRLKRRIVRRAAERVNKDPFGEIPAGPLEIFISIQQQRLHLYSDGVHIADAPVATGVPGHLTPLGIFSVIQRDRYHHSNIYSNAPMPYMERITWSGVALHEGPGVGHEASHGCIRMPHDFAAKLWMLPTMGMRVVIARSELTPLDFADPHLFVHKDKPPIPTVSLVPNLQTAQKVDPLTKNDFVDLPAGAPAAAPQMTATTSMRADGNAGTTPAAAAQAKAGSANAPEAPPKQPALAEDQTQSQPQSPPQGQAQGQPQSQVSQSTLAQIVKGAAQDATTSEAVAPAVAGATAQTSETGGVSAIAGGAVTSAKAAASTAVMPAQAAPTAPPVPSEANAASTPAGLTAPIDLGDVPVPLPRPAELAKGSDAPIAIFISRKESRIYVRQDFTPVFDAPVKIEDPTQPLGTYLFTAMDYMPGHSAFHWTVIALPTDASRKVERWRYVRDSFGRLRRVRVVQRVVDPAPEAAPETPQQALARIQIPQDVIDQISHLIVPGSSLIVSDQGLGPETGKGTDFIVVTR